MLPSRTSGLATGNWKSKIKISPSTEYSSRREIVKTSFHAVLGITFTFTHQRTALAEEGTTDGIKKPTAPKKPFAPAAALLPAARVKFTIDESIRLTEEYLSLKEETNVAAMSRKEDIMKILMKMIGVSSFMSPLSADGQNISKSKAAPIDENVMKPSKSKVYQETYNDKLKDISPMDVPYALLTKAGDYRQFDQLQKRQRKLEKLNPIREAMNYYTRQLQFDTAYYVLNASAEEKKRMIRNDALPDIKSVIVSDLDLRDLVRNQILDAYDDVKFELEYQMKTYGNGGEFDGSELRTVLQRAKSECDRWFSFIADDDVERAMNTVTQEE